VSSDTGRRPAGPPLSATRRHGSRYAVLALAALLAMRLPLPWMAAALVLVAAAVVEGILTARAIAGESRGRGLFVWCICGLVLLGLMGVGVAGNLALYPITYQRQECLAGANTEVAKAACRAEFDRRVGRLQSALLGG
jgi:hypothetical protein